MLSWSVIPLENMDVHGSEEQFLTWYDEYADAIFRHCAFRLSDREKAKDVTQETFIRLWNYVREKNEVLNVKSFLYKIANNLIIDEYRRKETVSLDRLQEESGFDVGFDDRKRIETEDEFARIKKVIDTIPKDYREAFILRHIDGLSVKEIAVIAGVSENVISVRIHRALSKIQQEYGKRT